MHKIQAKTGGYFFSDESNEQRKFVHYFTVYKHLEVLRDLLDIISKSFD